MRQCPRTGGWTEVTRRSGVRNDGGMAALFSGVGVALVTLFDDNRELDAPGTAELAGRLVGLGVRAVLVAGTTGEAATLTPEERCALVAAVRAAIPADVPVLAGSGAPTGAQAAELTDRVFDAGADAALVLSPPGVADPRGYYDRVAKAAAARPLLAYHFPTASSPGISVGLLGELPVSGIKDSSGDAGRLLDELEVFDGDLYTGSPTLLTMCGAVGAAGALLALANSAPEPCIAAFAGDGRAQVELAAAHRVASTDFPGGIKRMTAERFGVSAVARVGS
jgi:4-hydroxy-tetrahydrodipicolinate synthase